MSSTSGADSQLLEHNVHFFFAPIAEQGMDGRKSCALSEHPPEPVVSQQQQLFLVAWDCSLRSLAVSTSLKSGCESSENSSTGEHSPVFIPSKQTFGSLAVRQHRPSRFLNILNARAATSALQLPGTNPPACPLSCFWRSRKVPVPCNNSSTSSPFKADKQHTEYSGHKKIGPLDATAHLDSCFEFFTLVRSASKSFRSIPYRTRPVSITKLHPDFSLSIAPRTVVSLSKLYFNH
jgi:hypothetical protein